VCQGSVELEGLTAHEVTAGVVADDESVETRKSEAMLSRQSAYRATATFGGYEQPWTTDTLGTQDTAVTIEGICGASSWNPGTELYYRFPALERKLLASNTNLFNSAAVPSGSIPDVSLADGGNSCDINIPALVARGAEFVIGVISKSAAGAAKIATDQSQLDHTTVVSNLDPFSVTSLFGYGVVAENGCDCTQNQIFSQTDLLHLINALKLSLLGSTGVVVRQTYVTVACPYWNVPAGKTVTIVWVFNDAASDWVEMVKPNLGILELRFLDFSNDSTIQEYTDQEAFLLAAHSAWVVDQHTEKFLPPGCQQEAGRA